MWCGCSQRPTTGYHFNEQDVWTLFHSYAFDFSVWEIWGALLYGGRLVVVPFMVSRSPEAFYELLAREGNGPKPDAVRISATDSGRGIGRAEAIGSAVQ